MTVEGPVAHTELVETPAASLAVALQRSEIDQQIATAKAWPRSLHAVADRMITDATFDAEMAEECIYGVPRGGKTIRGESIRFAEIVRRAWGNCRDGARVTHVDMLERYVEAEGIFFDLESNMATTTRVRRKIELKKGKTTVDPDMAQLAGAAAMSIARRNAILGGVPKIAWKRASDAVKAVIRGDQKTLAERRDRALAYFQKAGVPVDRLLKKLEIPAADDITLDHLVDMQGWRTAIGSGEATLDELFPEERKDRPKGLADKMMKLAEPPQAEPRSDAESETAETRSPAAREVGSEQEADRGAAPPIPRAADEKAAGVDDPAAAQPEASPKPQEAQTSSRRATAAREEKPAHASPKARYEALQAKGEALALQGEKALSDWLASLSPDEKAAIGPIEGEWRRRARARP